MKKLTLPIFGLRCIPINPFTFSFSFSTNNVLLIFPTSRLPIRFPLFDPNPLNDLGRDNVTFSYDGILCVGVIRLGGEARGDKSVKNRLFLSESSSSFSCASRVKSRSIDILSGDLVGEGRFFGKGENRSICGVGALGPLSLRGDVRGALKIGDSGVAAYRAGEKISGGSGKEDIRRSCC